MLLMVVEVVVELVVVGIVSASVKVPRIPETLSSLLAGEDSRRASSLRLHWMVCAGRRLAGFD